MKSYITNRQMFFLLLLTLTSYTVISIPKVIAENVGTGGWLTLMIASLFFAAFVSLIVRLNNAFPGLMLYEYSQQIVGKILAYVLALYFLAYFLVVSVYLNMQLASVLKAEFYPRTPQWAMLIASVLVFGYVAYRGVNGVARFFEVIGTVFLITAVGVHVVMLLQGNLQEIRPFFRASQLKDYLLGTKDVIISFLGIEILTIFPFDGKRAGRSMATACLTVLLIGLFYSFVVETCIMMQGMKATANYSFALIEAIKLIDNPILERFDILYLTVGFAGLVAGICGVYLAMVEYAIRLFGKVNRFFIVVGVGLAIIGLSLAAQAIKPAEAVLESVLTVAGLIAAFVIPSVLFLIVKVRGLGKKPT